MWPVQGKIVVESLRKKYSTKPRKSQEGIRGEEIDGKTSRVPKVTYYFSSIVE